MKNLTDENDRFYSNLCVSANEIWIGAKMSDGCVSGWLFNASIMYHNLMCPCFTMLLKKIKSSKKPEGDILMLVTMALHTTTTGESPVPCGSHDRDPRCVRLKVTTIPLRSGTWSKSVFDDRRSMLIGFFYRKRTCAMIGVSEYGSMSPSSPSPVYLPLVSSSRNLP